LQAAKLVALGWWKSRFRLQEQGLSE